MQSSINVQQSIDLVNNNSEKCSGINVEQNIDVVNDISDGCGIVNVVADSQPVESLSSSEDPPSWAEVVAMEEAAPFTEPAPSMEPVQDVIFVVPFGLLLLAILCAFVRPPVRRPTLRDRPDRLLIVFFLFMIASSSVFNSPLSVLSFIVDGLRDSLKRAALLQWLHAAPSVDVVCLQEVHCVSESECQFWSRSSGFSSCVSPGSNGSCGCIVLFRPSLSLVTSWSDSEGRLLQCEFQLRGVRFRVVSLYDPNRNPQRNDFLDILHTYVDPSAPTILAGDFNSGFDRAVDRGGSCVDIDSRERLVALARLFTNCCCVDVWRHLFPSRPGFTWTRSDGVRSSRIDLIGCPTIWAPFILSCDPLPCPFSDQCGLRFSIPLPDAVPPGPGLCKFNISILEEDAYCQLIKKFWADWRYRRPSFSSVMDR